MRASANLPLRRPELKVDVGGKVHLPSQSECKIKSTVLGAGWTGSAKYRSVTVSAEGKLNQERNRFKIKIMKVIYDWIKTGFDIL